MKIDPFLNPELAPTDAQGNNKKGARFGCGRIGNDSKPKMHWGLDLKAIPGTEFKSLLEGKISHINNKPNSLGLYLIVRSNVENVSILYAHLQSTQSGLSVGSNVSQGEILGKTGKSGAARNVPHKHLHIECSTDFFATKSNHVDPEIYILTSFGDNPNPIVCPDKDSDIL